jgi:peptidoglycan/LPS O-acetylase OafA/YrhL
MSEHQRPLIKSTLHETDVSPETVSQAAQIEKIELSVESLSIHRDIEPTDENLVVKNVRLDSLTGLRFFAAMLVVLVHSTAHYVEIPVLRQFTAQGVVGVTFFFILSGFVLTWSGSHQTNRKNFYWKRFARIYPLHIFTFALMGIILAMGDGEHYKWDVAVLCLLLIQSWIPIQGYYFGGNGPSWSLSCEAFFYAAFPFLVSRISRLGRNGLVRLLVGLGVTAIISTLVIEALFPKQSIALLYVLPIYRIWEFVLGIILALAIGSGWFPKINLRVAVAGAVVSYAAISTVNAIISHRVGPFSSLSFDGLPPPLSNLAMAPAFAILICAAAQSDIAGVRSIFAGRVFVKLGEWSFALYLSHLVILSALDPYVSDGLGVAQSILVEICTLGLLISIAAGLYQFVERPIESSLRRAMVRVSPTPRPG